MPSRSHDGVQRLFRRAAGRGPSPRAAVWAGGRGRGQRVTSPDAERPECRRRHGDRFGVARAGREGPAGRWGQGRLWAPLFWTHTWAGRGRPACEPGRCPGLAFPPCTCHLLLSAPAGPIRPTSVLYQRGTAKCHHLRSSRTPASGERKATFCTRQASPRPERRPELIQRLCGAPGSLGAAT